VTQTTVLPDAPPVLPAYRPDVDVGSRAWAGRTRHRAKVLAEQVETGYLELGEILYRIYDAPVDGNPQNGPVLAQWGYKSITEYAEKELSLHYKKAQRLVRIFYRVEVELDGLGRNPDLKRRFIRLGWSKARELIRVLTKDNMVEWIERAEQMNYTTLVEVIKRTSAIEENRRIQQDLARQPDPIEASNKVAPMPVAPQPTAGSTAPDPTPTARPQGAYAEPTGLFVDRKWVSKVFSLESEQAETVNLALQRARDLTGEDRSPSTLLSLICLDFLSGADWSGAPIEQKLRYLAKIEKSIGLRLVVVNEDNDVVYGLGALAAAAQAAKEDSEDDAPAKDPAKNAAE